MPLIKEGASSFYMYYAYILRILEMSQKYFCAVNDYTRTKVTEIQKER